MTLAEYFNQNPDKKFFVTPTGGNWVTGKEGACIHKTDTRPFKVNSGDIEVYNQAYSYAGIHSPAGWHRVYFF